MNIEKLRQICIAYPAVTEDIKWETDLCFLIVDKMFCVTSLQAETMQFTFKASDEDYPVLIERDGFEPAPYLARAKWVRCTDTSKLKRGEADKLLRKSYELIRGKLPAKVRELIPV